MRLSPDSTKTILMLESRCRFFNGRPKTKGKKANPASFEAYSAAPLTAAATATESDAAAAAASDIATTTITGNEIAGMFRFHREPEEVRRSKA